MDRVRADLLLVELGLFESRAKARAAIEAGGVSADGQPIVKPAELVSRTAAMVAEPAHPWVGRGGLKLDHALGLWPVEVAGRVVLDLGASTGGFTEVCLTRGAVKVFAVDVGHGQLHPRLIADRRVVNLEGQDARTLTSVEITDAPDLIVCDASFIGLAKVAVAALGLAKVGADLVALVKPQFEVGRDQIGKGGAVRDPAARAEAVRGVADWLETFGWAVRATIESPVRGGDGAIEHLIWASKS